jgi:ankyrin repeat protein
VGSLRRKCSGSRPHSTPLISAASVGDADVVRALIEAGADLDAVSALERTTAR